MLAPAAQQHVNQQPCCEREEMDYEGDDDDDDDVSICGVSREKRVSEYIADMASREGHSEAKTVTRGPASFTALHQMKKNMRKGM